MKAVRFYGKEDLRVEDIDEPGDPAECDLIVALGGDGTTLAAVRVAAAVDRPVMGVACGSLGALTAVTAEHVDEALDRVAGGDWIPRRLPALEARLSTRLSAAPYAGTQILALGDGTPQVAAGGVIAARDACLYHPLSLTEPLG